MQIELVLEHTNTPDNLPGDFRPYRILYWFDGVRVPVIGQVIYLPEPEMAKRIEGSI